MNRSLTIIITNLILFSLSFFYLNITSIDAERIGTYDPSEIEIDGSHLGPPKIINRANLEDPQWLATFVKEGCSPKCLNYPMTVISITEKDSQLGMPLRRMANHIVNQVNDHFRMSNGNRIANFYLKDVIRRNYSYRDDRGKCQDLIEMGDGKITSSNGNKRYDGNEWRAAFQKCELKKDPDALNVYIYDAYDEDNNASDTTGRGNSNISNNYQAFILLDYNRLLQDYSSGNSQRPSSHEVGHALGLHHVCDPTGSKSSSPTNLMASGGSIPMKNFYSLYDGNNDIDYDCPYSAGNRTLGLNSEQTILVLEGILRQAQNWLNRTYGAAEL